MQQPYAAGLTVIPKGLGAKVDWAARRAVRLASKHLLRPLDRFGLERLRIERTVWARERIGKEVGNYTMFHAARTVDIAPKNDPAFLESVKYLKSGLLPLEEVFVCEVAPAFFYPHLGLVANESFEVFGDSYLLPHRFELSPAYRSFRPRRVARVAGPVSSIQRIDAYSFWHWMADCLPQLLTLERYMDGEPLTLLMTDDLGGFQRETLALMLPSNFRVDWVPARRWIGTDRFVLPSYLSGRCHGYLPEGYYAEIRKRIATGLGLPEAVSKPDLRLYLSRPAGSRRSVGNDAEVQALLRQYGFQEVKPEKLTMREQVEMFQRAEAIVGPHGGALGGMVFSTRAKVLVLYPQAMPGEFFLTMAQSVGIEHFGLTFGSWEPEDSITGFAVDLERLEAMLSGPMGLNRRCVG